MNNYEFCAQWAAQRGGRILDYGCGAGQIVGLMLDRGLDAYGCDVFYEGGDYTKDIPERLQHRIFRMTDRAPFPDGHFDCVVSNQVLEHVPNLDRTASDIARVLRTGGVALTLFPDRGVWREGHCGIPFLHRFPRGRLRLGYATTMRSLGLGYHTKGKSVIQWSRDFCEWLDNWTYYRPLREIHETFARHFDSVEHVEERLLSERLGRHIPAPVSVQRLVVRKLAGLAIVVGRHTENEHSS